MKTLTVLASAAAGALVFTALVGPMLRPAAAGAPQETPAPGDPAADKSGKIVKITKTDAEWKKILSPAAYDVLRHEGTEPAFSGDYKDHGKGIYRCAGCGLELFTSDKKFDSGTGWPSFWKAIPGHVELRVDNGYGMTRTEVRCARCEGHLGHVFDDGPQPTGLRYCMNSVALKFEKATEAPAKEETK